ncbi:hypothetical protein [Ehrlichia ruminantium]|uniref:Uncharacterized protein n=1 Tax=Ehrlichia ruminantium (strain Welgevonden) TaxID=254945 RepID=A0A0H3M5G9_EHRRW|nr:hypothetical protein [Ehrlichia ruminantium]QLK50306.1 hypothetical protein FDZ68_01275 [Ehrlichia ruminantium]QLK51230.1 hypothetical protein FDZ66_01280 [Ehrlichia ruminantium]QLK53065.1 hypothetical protein FDZ64_01275 [Ehrlichia ruminantium]QLK54903.1 hypothetical protein FDZ62_01300 [Ehrlichia ruminantium]QLK55820.1 hypothetical protein FDZ61_01300 [Ehrlichia ruminantium]
MIDSTTIIEIIAIVLLALLTLLTLLLLLYTKYTNKKTEKPIFSYHLKNLSHDIVQNMLYPPDNIKNQISTGKRAFNNIHTLHIDIPPTTDTQFKQELEKQLADYKSENISNPIIAKHLTYLSHHLKISSYEKLFDIYKERIILAAAFEKTIATLKPNLTLDPRTTHDIINHIGYTGFKDKILDNILNPNSKPTYRIINNNKKIHIIPSSQCETVIHITNNVSIHKITDPKKKYSFNTNLSFCILLQNNKLSYTQTLFSFNLPKEIKHHMTNKKRTAIDMATNPIPAELKFATLNYKGKSSTNKQYPYIIEYAMPNPTPLNLAQLSNHSSRISHSQNITFQR